MKTKSILLLILMHTMFWAQGQIVNIEKKRSSHQDSVFWIGDINLGLALIKNTKQITNISGAIRIDHVRHQHSFLSMTSYNLGRVDKEDFVNKGFQHFRYNYKINKRLTWEAFTQVQYNEQIQLQLRWLLGSGPRMALVLKGRQQLYLGVLYMYEYDEEKAEGEHVQFFRDHRLSSYLNIHLQPLSYLKINSTTYFQPTLNRIEDWRLSSETGIEMKISQNWTFNTTFTLLYDASPPDGIPESIYTLKQGLRLKF